MRSHYTRGCTSRLYGEEELKRHRATTIEIARLEESWKPGAKSWNEDRDLILFYAQCLDRRAFRTFFHQELSFDDFDRAMEETLTAINTGCTRVAGSTLQMARGKVFLVHAPWRQKMDQIASLLEQIRARFRGELGLDHMLMNQDEFRRGRGRFRFESAFSRWVDDTRQEILNIMNELLVELERTPLQNLKEPASQ